jgi:predicted nucleic acid-binding protein
MSAMPEGRTVVCNTSPLLYLHRIGELCLLRRLYGRVSVTRQVVEELAAGGVEVPEAGDCEWIDVRDVPVPATLSMVPDLGVGEASTLASALDTSAPVLLLLDDRLARRIAALRQIPFSGTAGVLLRAKERGLIGAVKPLLEKLIQGGFYLRRQHMADICILAGEGP